MKRKEISSASSSQSPTKKRRIDDESSSAPTDAFTSLMKEYSLKIRGSKWHLTGSTATTKRGFEKKYSNDVDAKKNILKAFFAHLSNEDNLKRALVPLIASANEDTAFMAVGAVGQESIVKMFLGVPATQTAVIDFLLEKIPDYMTDDDAMAIEENIPRLILSQFRWLDHIVDSEGLAKKLVETLSVCTPRLKKEIVSFIPEIVDDYGHQLIIDELRNMLETDAEFTVAVVDTLSNLNLKPEPLDKVRTSIIHMLDSSKIEDLPVLLKFILQSASSDAEKVAKEMRDSLNVETLSSSNSKNKEGEVLTFETLKTGIKYNKELPKAFLKLLSSVPPGGYRVLDVWLLYILHSIASCKTKIEPIFRKQISAGNISEVLFRKSVTGHTQALRTLFPEILSLAQMLVRSSMDTAHATFGSQMYKRLFTEFHEPYFQQEILMAVISHIGSTSSVEVMAALSIISDIVNTQHAMAKKYISIIQGLLDYFDLAPVTNINQIRKIYSIFCDLYFGDPFESSPTSDLDILLKKQLMNPDIKYQKMGIVGATCLISKLTSMARRQQQADNDVDTNIDFEHAREIVDITITKVERLPELQEFFYNELSYAVHWHDIADEVLDGFNENLLDVVGERMFVKPYKEKETNGTPLYVIDEDKYDIAVDIFNLVRAKGIEKTQLSWMIASMKFYMLINKKLNPSLTAIDALCGCPFLLSKEYDEDEFKLLPPTEKEDVCAELFHTINFLREIINIFSQQTDAKTQEVVVKRLEQVIDAERRLDMYLGLVPNFVSSGKPKAKPKAKGDGEKATQIDLVYTPTLNILRPLELASCAIMNYTDTTRQDEYRLVQVPPKSVYHLVKDLDSKLDFMLSHPKRILNPAVANAPPPSWSTLYKSKMDAVEAIKPVFAALCQRLKELAVPDNESEVDDPFINPSIGVILECLKKLFTCPVFYTSHQKLFMVRLSSLLDPFTNDSKEILSMILNVAGGIAPLAQAPKKMTLPTMLFKCFEYFSKFEPIVSEFESSKALLDLLVSIVTALDPADSKKHDLATKLSEYAGRLLFSRDWPGGLKVSSDAVVSILETNVKFSANSVETLTNITKELGIKSESPVRKSHSSVYFKVVIAEIAKLLGAHKLTKKKKDDEEVDSGKEALDFISKVSIVFKDLNDLTTLEDFQSPNVLIHFMKYGRKICDTIVQDIHWMSENFVKYREDILNVIKAFQSCTRKLQWYCENKKAAKDIKLLNSIPPLKKSLESFVLKIKKMFKSNGILTALWFGNLKHKTLSGQIVDSQIVKEEKSASEGSDNEAAQSEPEASDKEEENNSEDEKQSKKKTKKKKDKKKKEKSGKKKAKKKQIEEEEEVVEGNEEADGDEEPAEEEAEPAGSDEEVPELSVDERASNEDDNNGDNSGDEANLELNSDEV